MNTSQKSITRNSAAGAPTGGSPTNRTPFVIRPSSFVISLSAFLFLLSTFLFSISASAQTSAPATLTLKDSQNRDVSIPAPAKVTLLAFLRPGQAQTDEVLKLLAPYAARPDIQLIAVVSGDDAAAGSQSLTRAKWSAPIIIDTDYALSGRLSVKVWPTTVVVGTLAANGAIDAHLAGLPATFANDLAATVDFATGKIDRAAFDKALANREVVAESGQQRAARFVEVATRLAARGMADETRAELAKALELKPTDPAILLAIARVDLIIAAPQDALAILAQIKPGNGATPGDINVLKGWAAIQLAQWPQAKDLLIQAANLNPDPAEAFYLLGRVYDHDGDAIKAAEFYRKAFEKSDAGKQMGVAK